MNIVKSNSKELRKIIQRNNLKTAIKNAQGRVILTEIVVGTQQKYTGICNAKLMKNFGADLITLKKYNYSEYQMEKYHEYRSVGAMIGLNFEIKQSNMEAEIDTLTSENIEVIKNQEIDYIVVTVYPQSKIKLSEIKKQLLALKKEYQGLIILNYYVVTPELFKREIYNNIEELAKIIDAICIPIPGTVAGVNTNDVQDLITDIHKNDLLTIGTICTSQESANPSQISSLGLTAKQLGFDIHMFGDAAACNIPEELNVFEYSIAIRGKRHTYYRMVN